MPSPLSPLLTLSTPNSGKSASVTPPSTKSTDQNGASFKRSLETAERDANNARGASARDHSSNNQSIKDNSPKNNAAQERALNDRSVKDKSASEKVQNDRVQNDRAQNENARTEARNDKARNDSIQSDHRKVADQNNDEQTGDRADDMSSDQSGDELEGKPGESASTASGTLPNAKQMAVDEEETADEPMLEMGDESLGNTNAVMESLTGFIHLPGLRGISHGGSSNNGGEDHFAFLSHLAGVGGGEGAAVASDLEALTLQAAAGLSSSSETTEASNQAEAELLVLAQAASSIGDAVLMESGEADTTTEAGSSPDNLAVGSHLNIPLNTALGSATAGGVTAGQNVPTQWVNGGIAGASIPLSSFVSSNSDQPLSNSLPTATLTDLTKGVAALDPNTLPVNAAENALKLFGSGIKNLMPDTLGNTPVTPSGLAAAAVLAGHQAETPSATVNSMGLSQSNFPLSMEGRVTVPMTVAFGQAQWSSALAERTAWMVGQSIQSAEIQLDPPELGALQVKIHMHQDQASVTFVSANPQVRDAVEQTMGKLREMLQEQGLELVDSGVGGQSDKGRDQQPAEDLATGPGLLDGNGASLDTATNVIESSTEWGVDHYV